MNSISRVYRSPRAAAAVAAAGVTLATLLSTPAAQATPTPTGAAQTATSTASATAAATSTPSETTPASPTDTPPAPPTDTPPAPTADTPPTTPVPTTDTPTTPVPTTDAPTTAPTTPAPTSAPSPTSTPDGHDGDGVQSRPDVPTSTAAESAARREQARRLAAAIADQQAGLDAARVAVDDLGRRYDEAMTAKEAALQRQATALADRTVQEQRLEAAQALVDVKEVELRRWASQTYRNGPTRRSAESWMELLESGATDDVAQRVEMIEHVGRWRGSVVDTVQEAEAVQADATTKARVAGDEATAAAWQATMAAAKASGLLEQQRLHIALISELLAGLTGGTSADASVAEQSRLLALSGGANRLTGQVGSCAGADISSYPNGGVPVAALCPLWAAPGHNLRADAAHAFQAMSEAYAMTFGDPICVTDSYRTLDEQVAVYAAKPNLAARPGTSNHGWGRALDLCGGIQSFGTAPHEWMRTNAPLFGFAHPSWAQAGGSKPEPWHWEYAS